MDRYDSISLLRTCAMITQLEAPQVLLRFEISIDGNKYVKRLLREP
jgi:hypothetical protein